MTLVYDANLKFSLHTNCQLKQILAEKQGVGDKSWPRSVLVSVCQMLFVFLSGDSSSEQIHWNYGVHLEADFTCARRCSQLAVYRSICHFHERRRWVKERLQCKRGLLGDPFQNTNVHYWLMWDSEAPQMVLVIIHAWCSSFMTCK